MSVAQLVDTLQGAASSLDVVVGCMDAPHCHELVRELQAGRVCCNAGGSTSCSKEEKQPPQRTIQSKEVHLNQFF